MFPNVINQLAPSYEIHAFDDIYPQLGEKTIVDAEPVDTNAISSNLTPIEEVTVTWDDSIDDEGNYKQSYFKITLPILDFDLYACAAITQEMQINMRSGACIGCTFNVQVDWEDYKLNFYTDDLKFAPNNNYQGCRRDFEKYPDSRTTQLELICEKDTNTFGTLMPNTYQYPVTGDKFVILGISLPASYISQAESDLQDAMQEYMLENNVYYFDYPLKFDEYFLANNTYILQQIKNNTTIRFEFGDVRIPLYVKQLTINFGSSPLPQYNITLTDDIDIVLNQIGQVTEDVSKMRVQVGALQTYLDRSVIGEINNKLSKVHDDTASGYIAFLQGLRSLGDVTFSQSLKSRDFSLGNQGASLYPDTNGEWHFETDHLTVRKKFSAKEVEILKVSHVGGSQVLSPGSMVISRVENYQNYYRCYFKNSDEDGTEVLNTFALYDQAYCQTFNLETDSEGNTGNHYWWRLVVGIGDDYIDVCNIYRYSDNVFRNTDGYDRWSSVPQVGDNVVTLGNRRDTTRRNAIVLAGAGDGNPYLRLYTGISGFSLVNKVTAQISPSGSWITVTDSQGQSWNVVDLIESISSRVDNIEEQSDQQMVLWFGDEIPTLLNEPASEWVATDTENNNTLVQESHVHDMYYNRNSSQNGGGKAYEFINDNGVFQWVEITNVDVISALETANNAQDTADGKRRVFVSVPQPPYDEGDLWVNAVFPTHVTNNGTTTYYPSNGQYTVDDVTYTEDSPLYDNDVLRCVTPKNNSGAFNINDWTPAQYYTKNRIESKITQTVDEIRLDVGNLNNDLDTITDAIFGVNGLNNIIFGQYGTGGLNGQVSSLSVTVDGISQLVYDEDTGYTLSVQTVEGLVNTVSDLSGNYTTLSQTVSGLSSRVSTVEGWDSRITQNANNIALSVTKNDLETAGIYIDGENSRIILQADTTEVTDDLVVKQLETTPRGATEARVVIGGSTMEVYGTNGAMNIRFGVNEDGYAVMSYYDNGGNLLYDLGPNGLSTISVVNASFNSTHFCTDLKTDVFTDSSGHRRVYYQFIAKRVNGIIVNDPSYTGSLEQAVTANGLWFESQPMFDGSGNLTNTANRPDEGVRLPYDKIIHLQDSLVKASSINEYKEWVKTQYGFTDSDFNQSGNLISFAGDDVDGFWQLRNDVRVQLTRRFNNGVMSIKYIIWQE